MKREPVGRQNGAAIRGMRKLSRRGLEDTARQVGLEPQSLTNIENNSGPASKKVIRDIAALFGVPTAAITLNGRNLDEDETEPEEAEPEKAAAA